jgi:hypothetical protein
MVQSLFEQFIQSLCCSTNVRVCGSHSFIAKFLAVGHFNPHLTCILLPFFFVLRFCDLIFNIFLTASTRATCPIHAIPLHLWTWSHGGITTNYSSLNKCSSEKYWSSRWNKQLKNHPVPSALCSVVWRNDTTRLHGVISPKTTVFDIFIP